MLGSATSAAYEASLPLLAADPRIDAVIALFVPPVVAGPEEVAAAIARAAEEAAGKPVLAVIVTAGGTPEALRRGMRPVAAFPYPESAARALALAAQRAEWLRRPVGSVPVLTEIDRVRARAVVETALGRRDDAWLRPREARTLLEAYGVPLVPEREARDADEAVAAARSLGFPVVVKTAAAGAHKTDVGGVALDLQHEEEVREAAQRIGPPLVLQPMVADGVELLAGMVQDPVFGPLVAFGPGGVLAELIGEAGFRITPLTDVDAEELVHGGKAGRLVAGFRGLAPADAGALTDLLHRLSRLGEDLPEVVDLDLNPVLGLPDRCVAVDARVRVRRSERAAPLKSW
jgi:acyl-CoA synthetase (NDP forming)